MRKFSRKNLEVKNYPKETKWKYDWVKQSRIKVLIFNSRHNFH